MTFKLSLSSANCNPAFSVNRVRARVSQTSKDVNGPMLLDSPPSIYISDRDGKGLTKTGQEPEIVHIRGGDLRIHQYVKRVKAQRHATEAAVVQELVEAGYAETVRQLHARYQRGGLSLWAVAAELCLSMRKLYDLFEKKGLPT